MSNKFSIMFKSFRGKSIEVAENIRIKTMYFVLCVLCVSSLCGPHCACNTGGTSSRRTTSQLISFSMRLLRPTITKLHPHPNNTLSSPQHQTRACSVSNRGDPSHSLCTQEGRESVARACSPSPASVELPGLRPTVLLSPVER